MERPPRCSERTGECHRNLDRVVVVLLVVSAMVMPGSAQQLPPYTERVEVIRLLLDVRVVDDHGQPVRGLDADDFIVKVGRQNARVESAVWVGDEASDAPLPAEHRDSGMQPETGQGRLIVFLFQKSLEPSRIVGFMRMLIQARGLLDTLTSRDRVAVMSFDSRLQVWVDFTNDFARVRQVFEKGILFQQAGPVPEAASTSLVRGLPVEEARRTYSIERALWRIGDALADLPGSKSIVLVGHGFGRFGVSGVAMENDYDPMRAALQEARASVFSLDVTHADYHSLEAGLQLVSEHTGGFFARTHIFPERAMRELLGALAGHYTLFVELPALDEGTHATEITLVQRKGNVLARSTYIVAGAPPAVAERVACAATTDAFTPPSPYPDEAPGEGTFWHGTAALWTMLPATGTWERLPRGDAGYRQKVFLWRPAYDGRAEQWPKATVSGRRIDGDADPLVAEPATNAYSQDLGGWAMLVGVEVPTAGCWEVTARDGKETLTFVVRVVGEQERRDD